MDLNRGLEDLVAVALVAALAPLVVAALPGPRIPQVVIFLLGGVLIGPRAGPGRDVGYRVAVQYRAGLFVPAGRV